MRPVCIHSLVQAQASLDAGGMSSYLAHFGITVKPDEIANFSQLVGALASAGAAVGELDGFYVGYRIPQIGKEFDLLRFAANDVVNVEIKSEATSEKVRAQLQRNQYYLGFLGRRVHTYSFVASSRTLYLLRDYGNLEVAAIESLVVSLRQQSDISDLDPDPLFNPSNYLVSPFNSTEKFLDGKYFLTHQQEEFRTKIIGTVTSSGGATFISVTGSAGTGKTLLTFDIAKQLYAEGRKVLIVHCGVLNPGHHVLISAGWTISPIKDFRMRDFGHFDVVVVDEAQRIYASQFDEVVQRVTAANCACIFSHDQVQTLSPAETRAKITAKVEAVAGTNQYGLSQKIRTNVEIANFIRMLFKRSLVLPIRSSSNIKISYFGHEGTARSYLEGLGSSEWEVLRFTPSLYNPEHHESYFHMWSKNSHQVIGQEFDSVAIAVDHLFHYDAQGKLTYRGRTHYDVAKMLWQNLTRARRRINIVIIRNPPLLERCIEILRG